MVPEQPTRCDVPTWCSIKRRKKVPARAPRKLCSASGSTCCASWIRSKAKTLNKLAKHPYGAIRENVARHPNADAATLAWLSRDRSQPLWYLVAFNPNTPTPLQRRLRDRLKRLGENQPSK